MGVRVKICGITRYDDARIAVNLGADALGFIFHPQSPRYIQPAAVREIVDRLPPFVAKVGVFVNQLAETINAIAAAAGLDTIQLHGSESPRITEDLPLTVIKAFSVGPDFAPSVLDTYRVAGFLLDTWDRHKAGGTGKTFDWTVARRAVNDGHRIILAGGLGPVNVREAVEVVQPYAVDVSSGVEISPGIKSPEKMRDVIRVVKS
ncbi:MAG: phosphoribosylanthranilate isomerase [Chitinivibrionales bacterium]|nr:phosphoribosylanthranilate isomerase [Chitinivibrionales bacterium]MBD3356059.1 phosphoribosylanthranilate isomerase [Chitinivibrionales bacterium]